MEFTEEQWIGLKRHCDDVGLEFLSSPFSLAAVDLLERIGVKRYKIGSGEVSNLLLLEYISRTSKPAILSSGLSSREELSKSIAFLKKRNVPLSVLQCTTSYPTLPHEWGLSEMVELRNDFGIEVGFSDHSGDVYAGLFAVALGATILEVHAVFDKSMFGPDSTSSLTFNQLRLLKKGVLQFEDSKNGQGKDERTKTKSHLKEMFEKSLAVNKEMKRGTTINFGDLETKKPSGHGASASSYMEFIGQTLARDLNQWDFLDKSCITNE